MKDAHGVELVRPFCAVSDARGFYDLFSRYAGIFFVAYLAHLSGHWAGFFVAIVAIGGIQHGLLNLQHEAWHYLCFKNHRLNDFLGSWFYSYAVGTAYYFNQTKHRGHHAYFGTEKDPDRETYINTGKEPGYKCLWYHLANLLGGEVVRLVVRLGGNKKSQLPGMDLKNPRAPSLKSEYVRIALAQIPLFCAFALIGGWWYYFVLWLLPATTFFMFFATLRNFLEHANPSEDIIKEDRLYEFNPNFWERFFLSPVNFQYHAFHHAFPKVPHFRLKKARQIIQDSGVQYPCTPKGGYINTLIAHVQGLDKALRQEVRAVTGENAGG